MNLHRGPNLPPHPRPTSYRAFLLAAADWLDERQMEATVAGSLVAGLS